mmetsp:Transcript_8438/g.15884  ORF Transcript_8438/g.15884 Transcript_8438/m.15884 type:complete len:217 (-) Transcript_8438:539-1189(-)
MRNFLAANRIICLAQDLATGVGSKVTPSQMPSLLLMMLQQLSMNYRDHLAEFHFQAVVHKTQQRQLCKISRSRRHLRSPSQQRSVSSSRNRRLLHMEVLQLHKEEIPRDLVDHLDKSWRRCWSRSGVQLSNASSALRSTSSPRPKRSKLARHCWRGMSAFYKQSCNRPYQSGRPFRRQIVELSRLPAHNPQYFRCLMAFPNKPPCRSHHQCRHCPQ